LKYQKTPPIRLIPIAISNWGKIKPKDIEQIKAASGAPDKFVCGIFILHSNYDSSELHAGFAEEIQKRFKTGAKIKKLGRHSPRDALNALTALRLRHHCISFRAASNELRRLRNSENAPLYNDRTSFNRACLGSIKRFRLMFGLSSHEDPIHYTQGWQK
jgi:hypothetical protein